MGGEAESVRGKGQWKVAEGRGSGVSDGRGSGECQMGGAVENGRWEGQWSVRWEGSGDCQRGGAVESQMGGAEGRGSGEGQ